MRRLRRRCSAAARNTSRRPSCSFSDATHVAKASPDSAVLAQRVDRPSELIGSCRNAISATRPIGHRSPHRPFFNPFASPFLARGGEARSSPTYIAYDDVISPHTAAEPQGMPSPDGPLSDFCIAHAPRSSVSGPSSEPIPIIDAKSGCESRSCRDKNYDCPVGTTRHASTSPLSQRIRREGPTTIST